MGTDRIPLLVADLEENVTGYRLQITGKTNTCNLKPVTCDL
jgi:hypothetical protein